MSADICEPAMLSAMVDSTPNHTKLHSMPQISGHHGQLRLLRFNTGISADRIRVGHLETLVDVLAAVIYLASAEASWVIGSALPDQRRRQYCQRLKAMLSSPVEELC